VRAPIGPATSPGISRRQVLAGLLLLPPALAGCSTARVPQGPDPLIALADAARTDAALATAAITASPNLADRVQPLVEARTAHAAALDAEVARLDPARPSTTPATTPAPAQGSATLAQVRAAVLASGEAAATAALDLPAERVGLVASVAACCNAYAEVLT
jgi:hypothetical protein